MTVLNKRRKRITSPKQLYVSGITSRRTAGCFWTTSDCTHFLQVNPKNWSQRKQWFFSIMPSNSSKHQSKFINSTRNRRGWVHFWRYQLCSCWVGATWQRPGVNKATVAVRRKLPAAFFKFTVSFFAETNTGNTLMPVNRTSDSSKWWRKCARKKHSYFKYLHLKFTNTYIFCRHVKNCIQFKIL